MDLETPPICTTPTDRSPNQLCQDRHDCRCSCWLNLSACGRRSVPSSSHPEPQPLGCSQLDRCSPFHKRTHVQPHSQGAIRGWRWQGRCQLLCWWIPEPVRPRDADCCRYVYVYVFTPGDHINWTNTTPDGVLAFATISLALKVPRMADPRTQQIAVFVWGGIILGMYSFLLSVFRVKNGGYPFWLPPF